jgi:16S rRNA (adenine1518-N6/adenine1519-N6)-dimethyltransferase
MKRRKHLDELMRKYGAIPLAEKDQHFMVDRKLVKEIVDFADVGKRETVLEIGPGTGVLTKELAERAGQVIAVEKDRRFLSILHKELKSKPNTKILLQNALRMHLPHFDKLVSNIPYAISEPLLKKLINLRFKSAVITVPRGFAERLTARPGLPKYGHVSIIAPAFFKIEILKSIEPSAFEPQPRVKSAVIKLTPILRSELQHNKQLLLVRHLFEQGDKKVKNALSEAFTRVSLGIPTGAPATRREAKQMVKQLKIVLKPGTISKITDMQAQTKDLFRFVSPQLLEKRVEQLSSRELDILLFQVLANYESLEKARGVLHT